MAPARGVADGRRELVPPSHQTRVRSNADRSSSGQRSRSDRGVPVEQHVAQRVANVARCGQRTRVEPISEDLTRTLQLLVQAPRKATGEALHAAREHGRTAGFGQEMEMVREHIELDDPELILL